jgi:parvulin-like peptidyl-prolyl isomerase
MMAASLDGDPASLEGDPASPGATATEPDLAARLGLLDILIRVELATQEAYRLGFAPSGQELDALAARAVDAAGGLKDLNEALASAGTTMEQFRNQIARNEAMRAWRDGAFLAKAAVPEEEAKAFYDAHLEEATHLDDARAFQIMFPFPLLEGNNPDEAKERVRKRAEQVLFLARNGRDFEELARTYMDSMTLAAVDNGKLGWVGHTGTFPELEALILSLEPGEVGGPVETPFNIHIVKVMEKRPAGTLTFAELKPDIIELLAEQKIDELIQQRSSELLEQATVTFLDPEIAALWAEYRRTGAVPAAPPDPGSDDGNAPAPDGA